MGWRHIVISNSSKLSVKDRQLVITKDEKVSIPLEDISTVLIENNQSSITTYTLSKFSEYNIALYTCDERHLPNGVLSSFNNHSRQLSVLEMQINLPKPFKKRIWQNIITNKLKNQAKCLEYLDKEGVREILAFSNKVESGDKTNREACAAKSYFRNLFGSEFKRANEDGINAALNYGYSILRGSIARTFVGYGFNPCIGINHHSELNNFNLVDDFIEPYRPLVDLFVASNLTNSSVLTKEIKLELYNILNYDITINDEKHSVCNAIDIMIKSFVSCCKLQDYSHLKLPEILPIKVHSYE